MVESGILTMCYFSTSYLTERINELGIIDLPFIFQDLKQAHKNLDGNLGKNLCEKIEMETNFKVLGFWDNGFRHLSNNLHPIQDPSDCKNLKIHAIFKTYRLSRFAMSSKVIKTMSTLEQNLGQICKL